MAVLEKRAAPYRLQVAGYRLQEKQNLMPDAFLYQRAALH
jgi:hypothetical protein